jgi:hypothetical protein
MSSTTYRVEVAVQCPPIYNTVGLEGGKGRWQIALCGILFLIYGHILNFNKIGYVLKSEGG